MKAWPKKSNYPNGNQISDLPKRHPTAGTVAIGARMPLVAYNINLSTDNLEIATKIAKNIRHINGGLRYVKAMGVELKERNITQVSINMTDYTRTALYRAFELVRIEARRYGVTIVGSEIIWPRTDGSPDLIQLPTISGLEKTFFHAAKSWKPRIWNSR